MRNPRVPGIAFEVEPPARPSGLPRLDVAAFVGLAAAGPLHTPVAVEDAVRFRDLFGPDLPLAWNAEQNRLEHTCLGPAVEAFFHHGGRRCWVVRVAGPEAHTHAFPVPSLVDPAVAGPSVRPVLARARSAGSWAGDLRAGTRLARELLPLAPARTGESPFVMAPGGYRVDVDVPIGRVLPGDLIELLFTSGGVAPATLLYLEVERAAPRPRGSRLFGRKAFWLAADDPTTFLSAPPAALGSPPVLPSVRRLRFELLVWRGERLEHRLGDLAFSRRHPRFWGALPDDAGLFHRREGRLAEPGDEPAPALRQEAAAPRFPLAGPEAPADLYLPLGMGTELDPGAALPPLAAGDAPDPDGLGDLGWRLFVDPALAWAGHATLLPEAEHRAYELGLPLHGLHALLPIEEVSWVAVPDAVHPGFTRELPPAMPRLAAPELDPVPEPDRRGRHRLTWSAVPRAERYRLERAESPDLAGAVTLHEGSERELRLAPAEDCPRTWFFRVRALRGGEAGPWSNTRGGSFPRQDFAACGALALPELLLSALPLASPPEGTLLCWTALSGAGTPAESELEGAGDADFESARRLAGGPATTFRLPEILDYARFYRVRAVDGERFGPWSNTLVLAPAARTARTLCPTAEYDDGDLLAVHRALLRFAAARADLVAGLSLPGHYREAEVEAHLGALISTDPVPVADFRGVPPLGPAEEAVLGYGALYHPWIAWAAPAETAGGGVVSTPPDGAVAGSVARRTLDAGAWIAPANQPLTGVVALTPPFDRDAWERLHAAQVNLLRAEPRGFLVAGADTLSRSPELRPLSVRRLLILLRRLALCEGTAWVFEPLSEDFRGLARHRFERLLGELFARGAFAGRTPANGYRVVADDTVNPSASLDLGRFVLELQVAPSRPLTFLRVRLVQTGPESLAVLEG